MFGKKKRFQDSFYPGPFAVVEPNRFATISEIERDYPSVPERSCAKMIAFDTGPTDSENWFTVLPSTRSLVFEGSEFSCAPVNGPSHLVFRERLLRTAHSPRELMKFDPRPSIVWMFGAGEDLDDRATTRLGGLPYWPKEMPWPISQNGVDFQFFAGQIDFRGVLWPEQLPGEILTVHYDENWDGEGRFYGDATSSAAHLKWHNITPASGLVGRDDIPPPPEGYGSVGPYYGIGALITDLNAGKSSRAPNVYTLCATKIGGHSLFSEQTSSHRPWQEDFPGVKDPVFLCSFCTVLNAYVKDGGLPARSDKYPPQGSEMHWLSMGWMNIVYPRGRPEELFWNLDN